MKPKHLLYVNASLAAEKPLKEIKNYFCLVYVCELLRKKMRKLFYI